MATHEVRHPEEKNPVSRTTHVHEAHQPFWQKNQKGIIYGLVILILLVAGYFIYQSYFRAPEEKKAAEAMWKAEEYFRMDSSRLALNGDGANQGMLRIISKYGGTKSGNLAKFYAGASYLKLGDFANAIKYLKDFSSDDKLINVRATGLLGDAYAETGKKTDAVKEYRKAGTMFPEDDHNSPEYLFRAGLMYQEAGQNQEAIEMFRIIKDKYASSERGLEIDKYLSRLGSIE